MEYLAGTYGHRMKTIITSIIFVYTRKVHAYTHRAREQRNGTRHGYKQYENTSLIMGWDFPW